MIKFSQIKVSTFLYISDKKNEQSANKLPASEGWWYVVEDEGVVALLHESVDHLDLADLEHFGRFEGQKNIWTAKFPTITLPHPADVTISCSRNGTTAFVIVYDGVEVADAVAAINAYFDE